jgi:Ca2+-binding EF-hand superfamily protein
LNFIASIFFFSSALFDRIDNDHNGTITKQELKDWIKSVQTRYITDDVDRQWKQINNDSSHEISWDEYDKVTYHALCKMLTKFSLIITLGFLLDDDVPEPKQVTEQFLRLQKRDRLRFTKADENRNGRLNKREYADFIHPEQSPRMKDLFITETIEDIDKNKDGFISLEEFLGDMWDTTENNNTAEPDWVKVERENFKSYRDLDHDGRMNRKEVELWLMPTDYDNIQAETAHLFHEADQNQVKNLF